MKRLHIKIKHKLAWHFRKWANKLEPPALGLNPQRGEILYMGERYSTAATQIGVAASTRVEIKDRQYDEDTVTLQLLILEPKDHEN